MPDKLTLRKMMIMLIGDLVVSKEFEGIGKVHDVNEARGEATLSFFESPESPQARLQAYPLKSLKQVHLKDETVIYCIHPKHQKWQRARYGGPRPNNQHLVIYRRGEDDVVSIADIYVINIGSKKYLDPRAFLSQRCCDTPLFQNYRSDFISSYIEQRNSCQSISSVLSSGIELEPYQLAVVRRVLQDDTKKYLLADEVGLGKTIEAGMILRELITQDYLSKAIVSVPESLIEQWTEELTKRFFLEALLDENIIICSHENMVAELDNLDSPPNIILIDEAHQIADQGWSSDLNLKARYDRIAVACSQSDICLLLSGTPLSGNETNFLSVLHLLNPESYSLTQGGIEDFKIKVSQRESLGGIYQAFTPTNDNTALTDLLEQISSLIPSDVELHKLIEIASPLVDWLDGCEEGEDREEAINSIRTYLGDNYRLHQRMLRNRREDPYIASLFPGLEGIEILEWKIDDSRLSIERSLDAYRSEFFDGENATQSITPDNYSEWVTEALSNPFLISKKADNALSELDGQLSQFEIETLHELIISANQEQVEKDKVFINYLEDWMAEQLNGKAVVFTGNRENADHVTQLLKKKFKSIVERHNSGESLSFCHDDDIRILVCDQHGEDGLNLHGGKKVVIHYDLPTSISRIEQRLGRVNRYSADISAFPIKSVALRPSCDSYSYFWLRLLSEDIQIFNRTVASLQYVLEPHIETTWREISHTGYKGLSDIGDYFRGDQGLINKERARIEAQEQLNNLEKEIQSAQEYSSRIMESDEFAEQQAQKMQNWITRGLFFQKRRGSIDSSFRYSYQPSTLMDCDTFIAKCLLGIDFAESTHKSPVTHLMSFDRDVCAHGENIHPFRYGQPFLNTIYDALKSDSRGICSAQIRFLSNSRLKNPIPCFKIEWLASCQNTNQVIGDELYPPHVITQWVSSNGEAITSEKLVALLKEPYDKKGNSRYKDINLRAERWENVEDIFPEDDWPQTVENIYNKSYQKALDSISNESRVSISLDCLSFSLTIIA